MAGFGAEIAASAAEATGCRIRRLGAPRIPVGYAHTLEEAARVRPAAIVAAALEMLRLKRRVPVALEEGLAVACMALLLVITMLNVLTRYFTDQSFAWTEEISVVPDGADDAGRRQRRHRARPPHPHRVLLRRRHAQRQRRLKIFARLRDGAAVRWCWRCSSAASSPTRSASRKPRWAWACRAGGSRCSRRCCASPSRCAPPAWPGRRRARWTAAMIGFTLFMLFIVLMLAGVPIGAALGLGGIVAIAWANADTQWWGLLAAPQNMQAGIAKYPLLALPMFVLVGSIFDRSGVAQRLVDFAVACVGRSAGMLPMVAILVAMVLGGISGSGPANAAAVGGVMIAAMAARRLPGAVLGQRGRLGRGHRHPDPAVDRLRRLQRVGARRVGAGAVCRRHAAGHAGRAGADRAGGVAVAPARLWRGRSRTAAPALLAQPAPGGVGAGRAGADPGRHARGLVHAHRSRRGGRGLRPVRRHGDPPHDRLRRPVRDLPRRHRDLGGDHDRAWRWPASLPIRSTRWAWPTRWSRRCSPAASAAPAR